MPAVGLEGRRDVSEATRAQIVEALAELLLEDDLELDEQAPSHEAARLAWRGAERPGRSTRSFLRSRARTIEERPMVTHEHNTMTPRHSGEEGA